MISFRDGDIAGCTKLARAIRSKVGCPIRLGASTDRGGMDKKGVFVTIR